MTHTTDLLIIDDDAALAEMLALHFDDHHLTTATAGSAAEARTALARTRPRAILLDQHLPDTSGLKLLGWLTQTWPGLPVIMMTGFHEMDLVITAMKNGAFDYIHKPLDTLRLDDIIKRALTPASNTPALKAAANESGKPQIIGTDPAMLEVAKNIAMAAESKATVLIHGASGTGKELVASAIHEHSGGKGPFVAINCSAIVDTLLESELFGHEKGSFTGAERQKPGKFELAAGGTLFLDEIGEMSPHLQAKLLRVLQEHTFERVGGTQTLTTDARIIAATHRNLNALVKSGQFREDLMYRLQVINITLPPLKDRMGDFAQLASHLLMRANMQLGKHIQGLSADAMHKLKSHTWPGNIRELENCLLRAAAACRTTTLSAQDIHIEQPETKALAPHPQATPGQPLNLPLEEVEKRHILAVFEETGGNKSRTCDILGISRPALDRRLKKWEKG